MRKGHTFTLVTEKISCKICCRKPWTWELGKWNCSCLFLKPCVFKGLTLQISSLDKTLCCHSSFYAVTCVLNESDKWNTVTVLDKCIFYFVYDFSNETWKLCNREPVFWKWSCRGYQMRAELRSDSRSAMHVGGHCAFRCSCYPCKEVIVLHWDAVWRPGPSFRNRLAILKPQELNVLDPTVLSIQTVCDWCLSWRGADVSQLVRGFTEITEYFQLQEL